jgi:predicted dehydrogenase
MTDRIENNVRARSRREFLQVSGLVAAAAAVAGPLSVARSANARGSDVLKVALIGAGGRGTGAAANILGTKANVRLVAMADAFGERLDHSLKALKKMFPDRVDVPEERKFTDMDGYQKAIDAGVDLVLLCSPPGFRPVHFEAAVKAGKHAFLEKPVATDGPGVRRVMAANEEAKRKGLAVAVGHHLRHETKHQEVVRRMHDGQIGAIQQVRVYFNSNGVWVRPRLPGQTEMQYQVRNWYYFNWLSGDHIVEKHVHDIDVGNWIKQAHPVRANGMGGRQVRIGKDYGEIFDHHAVEFEYADGARMFSFCRHIPGCWNSFSEHAQGTKGHVDIEGHGTSEIFVDGQEPLRFKRGVDGHQVEMDDLVKALQAGQPYNEGDHGAEATLTAILGRMATYSGKVVEWNDALQSKLDLAPERLTWDAQPKSQPGSDGLYPCAIPGVTKAF